MASYLVAGVGFEPTTFGLCLPLQLSLPGYPVCGLDFPFTLDTLSRSLGCLPSSLYTFSQWLQSQRELGSGLPD
jgi:hypothetical protein